MIFNSLPAFFAVYIPLVLIAACSIIFEEKFVAFEQRLKKRLKRALKTAKQKTKIP